MNQSKPIVLAGGYDAKVVSSPIFNNDDVSEIHEKQYQCFQINRIVSLPDNRYIVAGNPYFYVSDFSNLPDKYIGHQTNITDITYNENKIYTCSEDCTWRIWELKDSNSKDKQISRNQFEKKVITNSPLNSIQVTRDNRYVFVANERGEVELYDTQSKLNNVVDYIKLSEFPVRSIALSIDDKRLIAACHDGNVFVLAINFSNISKILENKIAKTPSSFTVFQEIIQFNAHKNVILRCIISPDQQTFITTSADSTAKIWDFNNYEMKFHLVDQDIKKWVWDAAYTADSKYVVTGGTDKICMTWDISNGNKVSSKELGIKGITALAIYYKNSDTR